MLPACLVATNDSHVGMPLPPNLQVVCVVRDYSLHILSYSYGLRPRIEVPLHIVQYRTIHIVPAGIDVALCVGLYCLYHIVSSCAAAVL